MHAWLITRRYPQANQQHPALALRQNVGAATETVLVLCFAVWSGLGQQENKRCAFSIATATCRVLLRSVCCFIPRAEIKETSVWIPFNPLKGERKSEHLVVIHYSLQKLSLCLKTCKCFPDSRYTWKPVKYLQAMFRFAWLSGQQCFSVKRCSSEVKYTDITGKT